MAVPAFRCAVEDAVDNLRRQAREIDARLASDRLSPRARQGLLRRRLKIPKLIYAATAGKFTRPR